MQKIFITGIDTDSGKTLAAAIVCEALQADYWKPIQSGTPRDTDTVKALVSNTQSVFHPEHYLLQTPASPHMAARLESRTLQLSDIQLPATQNHLIVEGAGGCLVPVNQQEFVIDIAVQFNLPVVLVADLYLGSINHTLLTANLLKQKNITVKGIIFNGEPNPDSESIILHHTGYKKLLHIVKEKTIDKSIVLKYAALLKATLHD